MVFDGAILHSIARTFERRCLCLKKGSLPVTADGLTLPSRNGVDRGRRRGLPAAPVVFIFIKLKSPTGCGRINDTSSGSAPGEVKEKSCFSRAGSGGPEWSSHFWR